MSEDFVRAVSEHHYSSGILLLLSDDGEGEPAEEGAVSTERCRSFTHQRTQM